MIKGGITQIGMAQRIAYPYSHSVSFILSSLVEVSSFILSNNHTLIHMLLGFDYYVDLQSSRRLKISGSFYLVEVNTDINLNSVTCSCISRNSSVWRAIQVWSKNWKSGCWFDPSAHHYLPNTVRLFAIWIKTSTKMYKPFSIGFSLQSDFSVGGFVPEKHILRETWRSYWVHWFETRVS